MSDGPELSVVIPVHNESAIMADSVAGLLERLPQVAESFEILLCENGSRDSTLEIAKELERRHAQVGYLHRDEPDYGQALREGILLARGKYVVCDEIDLCDTGFYREALSLLRSNQAELVVGSKVLAGARDQRPWVRHLATQVFNTLLRAAAGFRGTDTHGLKAFVRKPLLPVVLECVLGQNLFASEFVIRAERNGRRIREIPLDVREKRRPTINLVSRVPRALWQIGQLAWLLRVKDRARRARDA